MAPESRFVRANGITLHYVDWGGDGPPVVMAHPTGFLARIWDALAEPLTAQYHVLGLDFRGHGDSDKPESGYEWPHVTADLREFIRALDLRRPVGIGHSAGATAIATVEAENPGTFSRTVFIDPIIITNEFRRMGPVNPMADRARKRRMVWDSVEEIFESYRGRPPFDTWRPEIVRLYVEEGTRALPDGRRELKCPGPVEALFYEVGPGLIPDPIGMLARVACPTLVLRGSDSTSFPVATAERVADALPSCRLVTLPNTTHFLPMEEPEAVLREIEAFLSD